MTSVLLAIDQEFIFKKYVLKSAYNIIYLYLLENIINCQMRK